MPSKLPLEFMLSLSSLRPLSKVPLSAVTKYKRIKWRLSLLCLVLCLLGSEVACSFSSQVTRSRGGIAEIGRKVPSAARAWYLRGTRLEQNGQIAGARLAYSKASKIDPLAGSPKAALGRLLCLDAPNQALKYLAAELLNTDEQEPLLVELAYCHLKQGKALKAEVAALKAIALNPRSEKATTSLVLALSFQGRSKSARLSNAVLEQMQSARLKPQSHSKTNRKLLPSSVKQIDFFLRQKNYSKAEALALEFTSLGDLACRAYSLGQLKYALALSKLLATSEPHQADALVIRLTEQLSHGKISKENSIDVQLSFPEDTFFLATPEHIAPACNRLLQQVITTLETSHAASEAYLEDAGSSN